MQQITSDEFDHLLATFQRSAVHLEKRDAYGTETELPYMAKWSRDEPDDLKWLNEWCSTVRQHVSSGRTIQRARIVSEPLSDYQHWSYSIAHPMVEAGEDIRWVPRPLVSAIGIPGNDYYLIDDELAIFLHYAGSGLNIALTKTADPAVVRLCRSAFNDVWELSIPHSEYKPV